jgi:hypothetical protein
VASRAKNRPTIKVCWDSSHGEPKMVDFENRSGAYFWYVSNGSAENRHLQAVMA